MDRARRLVALIVMLTVLTETLAFALGSKNAAYVGGTVTVFGAPEDPVEGRLDTSNADAIVFTAIHKKLKGRSFRIAYDRIADLEYGQKAGRRVGAAAATTVLLGPIGLLSLFSKKRKHYSTVGFADDAGSDQVVVLELGKDIVRTTLAVVETRSGKEIQYQDEEARKSAK